MRDTIDLTRRAVNPKHNSLELMRLASFLSTNIPPNGLTLESQREAFYRMLQSGQRVGQAFMNVLDSDMYTMLSGSLHDPFYKDDAQDVLDALEWATS